MLRAGAHPASTPGSRSLHSWRFSTRAENFHGAEARATDGGRGGSALVAGCQPLTQGGARLSSVALLGPLLPCGENVTLCVSPHPLSTQSSLKMTGPGVLIPWASKACRVFVRL